MTPFIANSKPNKQKSPDLWFRNCGSSYPWGGAMADRAHSKDFWSAGENFWSFQFVALDSGYMHLLSL